MEPTPLLHILLIEDNKEDISLLQQALRESTLPYQMSVVEDGEQALAFLRQNGSHPKTPQPDLIIFNLSPSQIDRFDVLRTLRTTLEWKTIPMMIFAGVLWEKDYEQATAHGVERCLQKPVLFAEYLAVGEDIAVWWQLRARPHFSRVG